MNTKRFFWLKLKNDFFDQKEIKMLRRLAGGDTFTVIYLKILLLSLKNDGRIYYDGVANNMVDEIALEIDEDIENTQVTFNYLQQKGLIVFNADDEIEISNIASLVGSESDSARRVRKHREKKALHCNTEVTPKKHLGNTEIEIELEIDKEIDKEIGIKPKKAKSIKKTFGEFENVKLTETEFNKLKERFPNDLNQRIDKLSGYVASTGKTYKSHYATIITWAKKDEPNQPKSRLSEIEETQRRLREVYGDDYQNE